MSQPDVLGEGASRVAWFENARFGMYIHFGLYSIPGGVWSGRRMGRNDYAEWIRYQLYWPETHPIPKQEYDSLLAEFNPTGFNAEEWMLEAKAAGMRYLVVTTKHHDGFALWHSKVSDYNVVTATPFGRDIIAELVTACRKHGIKVGFYYSHWQDWESPGGARPFWEVDQPSQEAIDQYWEGKCLPQVKELLDNFSPDLLWFDSWGEEGGKPFLTKERLDRLITLIRTLKPACLINSRIGREDGIDFISANDNEFPDKNLGMPWETPGTFNESWGYHRLDTAWKPSALVLRHLVNNVSRGGNYTLNVGPTGDGVFQSAAIDRLHEVGSWMRTHGDAIYGTRPVNYPEPQWGRLTQKSQLGGIIHLYAFVYSPASDGPFTLVGVQEIPKRGWIVGQNKEVTVEKTAHGIRFDLPDGLDAEPIHVVVFEFESA